MRDARLPGLKAAIDEAVAGALAEDAPWGDVTSELFVPIHAKARAVMVARVDLVFVGTDVVRSVFDAVGNVSVEAHVNDGESAGRGVSLVTLDGDARAILFGERVALNFCQRLSATATLTRRYVKAVEGTQARIVDTRKTTPGLRQLEKYAVRCGGGQNHRFSLSDAVMVKDNHLAALNGRDITTALQAGRALLSHTTHFEVEIDSLDQLEPVLAAGPDSVLLDNFSVENLRAAVQQTNGRALLEASGGVNLDTVRSIAETGVNIISVGALTHSAGSIDIGLDFL